jgi:signal transduction histidine kinase
MGWGKTSVFLIFFLFSGTLFICFELYHFYLVFQTRVFFEEFESSQIQRSFEDFQTSCVRHDLFHQVFALPSLEGFAEHHFLREISRIESSFHLEALLVTDPAQNLVLGTEAGKLYLRHRGGLSHTPDESIAQSQRFALVRDNKLLGYAYIYFPVVFRELLVLQSYYLKAGFFLFMALFSGGILLVKKLLDRMVDLHRSYTESQRLAKFGTLAAGVAHDIRNPLGIMRLQIQELKDLHSNDSETQALLSSLQSESKRINHSTGSLLVFQKENLVLEDEIDFPSLVAEVLEHEEFKRLKVKLGLEPFQIKGNRDLIYRMFENLLRNADEAGGKGEVRVRIQGSTGGGGYGIKVEDDGEGMQSVHQIFEPFFTTKAHGTGLGLLVVKDAVERHGGRIKCESKLGAGTSFSIYFPLEQPRRI